MPIQRNRVFYFFLILLTTLIGLSSRSTLVPDILYPYLGDFFYTLLFFWMIGFLFTKMSPFQVALISILLCYAIELLQFYQADWINQLRSYRLGGLILGHGFLWSDLLSYTLGGISAYLFERWYYQKKLAFLYLLSVCFLFNLAFISRSYLCGQKAKSCNRNFISSSA